GASWSTTTARLVLTVRLPGGARAGPRQQGERRTYSPPADPARALLGGGRVDHGAHRRDPVGREAAGLGVLPDELLAGRDVDAVDRVVRDIALDPLDLGTQRPQDLVRLLRDGLELLRGELPGAQELPLDHVLGHAGLLFGCWSDPP